MEPIKLSFWQNLRTFGRNVKRAFQYSWESSPGTTVAVFLFSIIIAVIPFAQAKVLGSVVNVFVETLGTGVLSAALWGVVALYIAVSTVPDLLYAIKGYLDRRWRLQVQKHLDILLAERRGALDLAYHDSPDYQNLLQRVWWRGDNLAYLGELGARANGVTFEVGKAFRFDKTAALALPAGVPE